MEDQELRLEEAAARRVLLVRAIEEVDAEGRWLGAAEREPLEAQAAAAARAGSPTAALAPGAYLQQRASLVLAAVERRQPRVAALQAAPAWQRMLAWGAPLAALVLGAALDRIDNPEQVNMLSPPLLAVLLWNLLAYALLLFGALWPAAPGLSATASLHRWRSTAGRSTRVHKAVAARFHALWLQATAREQGLWVRQVLHATAAGWALGLALSIVVGGLVRQYRVGWESTLLDLGQVHAFLSFLFAPVVGWLPFEPFSPQDLQRMHFAAGGPVAVEEARRWVWMYLALLAVVVIVPRALLAAWAGWRRHRGRAGVRLDLREPYFREVLARVSPTHVTLALLAQDAGTRQALLRALEQVASRAAPQPGTAWPLATTAQGDQLQLVEVPAGWQPVPAEPPPAPTAPLARWLALLRPQQAQPARRPAALQALFADSDVVLMLPGSRSEVEAATPMLLALGKPVLLLVRPPEEGGGPTVDRDALQRAGLAADTLDLAGCTRNWSRDTHLLDALRQRVPATKAAGFARLAAAWQQAQEARHAEAMRLLATLLARAAGEFEEVAAPPGPLRRLLSAAEREADRQARQVAMEAVLHRLRAAEAATLADLARLHGLQPAAGPVPIARSEGALVLQGPANSRQLGMAGAATGAAMGASIDLMTGGLTLGAAAALGAVIGGSASYAAAAWRNREAPSGRTQVQLADEMLQALAENLLLHYLAAAERSRSGEELEQPVPARWRSEVVAAVEAHREPLQALWQQARAAGEPAELQAGLARELDALARELLRRPGL